MYITVSCWSMKSLRLVGHSFLVVQRANSFHKTLVKFRQKHADTSECAHFCLNFRNSILNYHTWAEARKRGYWKPNCLCGTSRRVSSLRIWVMALLMFQCFTSTHDVAAILVSKWEVEAESNIAGDVWRVGGRAFNPIFLLTLPSWQHTG